MGTTNLKVYLPFDSSTTEDLCGNSWTAYGSPTVSNGAAHFNGTDQYLELTNFTPPSELFNSDFTIHFYMNYRDSKVSECGFFTFGTNVGWQCYRSKARFNANCNINGSNKWLGIDSANLSEFKDSEHHFAIVRKDDTLYFFFDGTLKKSYTVGTFTDTATTLHIARRDNNWTALDMRDFCIHTEALWTENFTPPTDSDYAAVKLALGSNAPINFTVNVERKLSNRVEFNADVERRFLFRYFNPGDADDLIIASAVLTEPPITQSKTGSAFYQTTHAKCFDIPATDEVWIKFDVYFDGTNRWRAYNGGSNDTTGITAQTDGRLNFFSNGSNVTPNVNNNFAVLTQNTLQTILLHMTSGSSAGVVEAWVDGQFIYRYTGDVNHGENFSDIYLQSDGAGTFFSNVIISNKQLTFGDGFNSISFDTECRIKNIAEFSVDLERVVKNVTNVDFLVDVERRTTLPVDFPIDVERTLIKSVDFAADVEILDVIPVEFTADVNRAILSKIILFPIYDTLPGGDDTLPGGDDLFDEWGAQNTAGLQSFEITLSEQQLSDQVRIVGTSAIGATEIMTPVQHHYLDYVCDMRVEKVQQTGILFSCECCSNVDKILYTQLNYQLDDGFVYFMPNYETMTLNQVTGSIDDEVLAQNQGFRKGRASKHFEKIANLMGLECICQIDDFISNMKEKQEDVTYNDLISQLFGWSSRLPQRMINCFVRDGKLIAIQRGKETNVVDLSDADKTLPTIDKTLMRTLWGSGKFGITPTTQQEHVNNKRQIGGHKVYPMPDSQSPDGKTSYVYKNVSGYGGIDHGYALESSTTRNDDGSKHEVRYIYGESNGVFTCTQEISTDYDAEGHKVSEHTTIHHNLTPSQQFSRSEDEDGITTSSNVGSNLPGFYNQWYWLELPVETGKEYDQKKITGYNLLTDSTFPVCDSTIYPQLLEALKWLNLRTQETGTLSVYGLEHLIDFNDKIILDGKEYFLVRNTARTTPRIFNEQKLTLRRWY